MSLKEAFENPEAIHQRKLDHRKAMWSRMQAECPDVADFIGEVTTRFGKPEQVLVTLQDGTTLDSLGYGKGGE
jgi:hypothetical protein